MTKEELGYIQRTLGKTLQDYVDRELSKYKAVYRGGDDPYEALDGERIPYTFTQFQTFTSSNDGARGAALTYSVDASGPFVMTHYPIAMWKSTLPTSATDFGRWRSVNSAYLATQALTTNYIDISYEWQDSGSGRQFQDNATPAGLMSYPNDMKKLPRPFLFKPNTTISVIVTYDKITFSGSTPTTAGSLAFTLPGYKILR